MKQVPTMVLTGGPCAGKTTSLCYLQEKLRDFGFYVIIMPEIPTLLLNSGFTPKENIMPLEEFQELILRTMLFLRKEFVSKARKIKNKKSVLICDRGIMDIKPYMPNIMFEKLFEQEGLTIPVVRDELYDAVFHLRTAALGAEEFYTLDTNPKRFETLEEAREMDEKTLQSWVGHPHLKIIDNSTDFEGKLKRLLQGLCHSLGIPVPLEIERKFLVDAVNLNNIGLPYQDITIEQMYLMSPNPNEEIRVRKRGQDNSFVYYQTKKQALRRSVRVEKEKHISVAQYVWSKQYRIPDTFVLKKSRNCFVFNNQYFELDVFDKPHQGLSLLEIELTEENDEVSMPPFINVIKEVTDDPLFSNRILANIK